MKMTKEMLSNEPVSRKDFLKMSGLLAAGLIAIPIASMFKPVTNIFSGLGTKTKVTANYETLIQDWWKWYFTGMQRSPFGMQFLAGTGGGYAERKIVAQGGNLVFFSPLNYIGKAEDNTIVPGVYDVKTNIPLLQNLGRITSPKPFDTGVKDAQGNLLDNVIADGYWFLGGPLEAGSYDLNMWGVSANGKFKNSVKYGVIVV